MLTLLVVFTVKMAVSSGRQFGVVAFGRTGAALIFLPVPPAKAAVEIK